ncbi:hypothetical protein [Rossellomorea marisflavi]|uniref:hypothetical protein n=1 Tax=Rossellomorea marisflavi TaxID=189381 RepID=UPI0009A8FA9C|nr:hypothetical protein [Rossellomorea marisflavi]
MAHIEYHGELEHNEQAQAVIEEHVLENLCGTEFSVYDEDGAVEAVTEHIRQTVWAFRADFIAHRIVTTEPVSFNELVRSIEKVQELCEGANALLLAAIDDFDMFVSDAIGADGCGHFLNHYDGHEEEIIVDGQAYYIYRQN